MNEFAIIVGTFLGRLLSPEGAIIAFALGFLIKNKFSIIISAIIAASISELILFYMQEARVFSLFRFCIAIFSFAVWAFLGRYIKKRIDRT